VPSEVAVLTHKSPGRTRLRIPARRNDEDYFASLAQALRQCPGVQRVETNPRTAGVLLLHNVELEAIFVYAEQRELFNRPRNIASEWVLEAVAQQLAHVDDRLLQRSSGRWGLSSLAFYGLIAATGYQLYRGNVLPAAETLLQHTLKLLEDKNS
jgi:heavy-metal-associated domain-containing protein